MSEISATLGLPAEFVWKGETYKVAARDYEIEGLFEKYVESQALAAVQRHREELSVADYALQMEGWRRECATHAYHFDGLECWTARNTLPGYKHLITLQLAKGQPNASRAELRMLVEEVFADEESRKLLEAAIEQANADPNRPRPWKRAAG